jgi:hypothetical protein
MLSPPLFSPHISPTASSFLLHPQNTVRFYSPHPGPVCYHLPPVPWQPPFSSFAPHPIQSVPTGGLGILGPFSKVSRGSISLGMKTRSFPMAYRPHTICFHPLSVLTSYYPVFIRSALTIPKHTKEVFFLLL